MLEMGLDMQIANWLWGVHDTRPYGMLCWVRIKIRCSLGIESAALPLRMEESGVEVEVGVLYGCDCVFCVSGFSCELGTRFGVLLLGSGVVPTAWNTGISCWGYRSIACASCVHT